MSLSCSNGSCKTSEKIWGLSSKDGKKIHRLTFSKSLAEYLARTYDLKLNRYDFILGRTIEPGTILNHGCYAIISKKKDITLRISLHAGIAETLIDDSRYLRQAFITQGEIA